MTPEQLLDAIDAVDVETLKAELDAFDIHSMVDGFEGLNDERVRMEGSQSAYRLQLKPIDFLALLLNLKRGRALYWKRVGGLGVEEINAHNVVTRESVVKALEWIEADSVEFWNLVPLQLSWPRPGSAWRDDGMCNWVVVHRTPHIAEVAAGVLPDMIELSLYQKYQSVLESPWHPHLIEPAKEDAEREEHAKRWYREVLAVE